MSYTAHLSQGSRSANMYAQRFARAQADAIGELSSGETQSKTLRAIGTRYKAEQRALTAAGDNITSTKGMLSTIQSGLFSIQEVLTVSRGLAARVSAGGMSATELAVAQQEYSSLLETVDDISQSSTYKGRNILFNPGSAAFVGDTSVKPAGSGASTRGFISFDPKRDGAAVVNVSGSNGNLDVEIELGDLKLTANTAGLKNGDELVLTAADGYTSYGYILKADPGTATNLTTALTTEFENAVAVGASDTAVDSTLSNTGANSGFSAIASTDINGFVDGRVVAARASTASAGRYNIFVELDSGQQLAAYNVEIANFRLIDSSDPTNSVAVKGNAGKLADASKVTEGMATFFNLRDKNAAYFSAGIPAYDPNASYNGFDHHNSLSAVNGAKEGKFSFSYNAQDRAFKLSGGGQSVSVRAGSQQTQNINFGNGLTVRIGSQDNPFNVDQDIDPVTFSVASVDKVNFQASLTSEVKRTIELMRVNAASLGLADSSIGTAKDAKTALQSLEAALATTSVLLARTGGQQRWTEAMAENVSNLADANREAANLFLNIDVGQSLTDYSELQAKAATATYAFSGSIRAQRRLLDIVIS